MALKKWCYYNLWCVGHHTSQKWFLQFFNHVLWDTNTILIWMNRVILPGKETEIQCIDRAHSNLRNQNLKNSTIVLTFLRYARVHKSFEKSIILYFITPSIHFSRLKLRKECIYSYMTSKVLVLQCNIKMNLLWTSSWPTEYSAPEVIRNKTQLCYCESCTLHQIRLLLIDCYRFQGISFSLDILDVHGAWTRERLWRIFWQLSKDPSKTLSCRFAGNLYRRYGSNYWYIIFIKCIQNIITNSLQCNAVNCHWFWYTFERLPLVPWHALKCSK